MIKLISDPHISRSLFMMLYVGPDQALPVLSFLAASLGFLLMCWRRAITLIKKGFNRLSGKQEAPKEEASLKQSSDQKV